MPFVEVIPTTEQLFPFCNVAASHTNKKENIYYKHFQNILFKQLYADKSSNQAKSDSFIVIKLLC